MTLRHALLGLLALGALALAIMYGLFRALDRPRREAFEKERAEVVFASPRADELEGRYEDLLETRELQAGGRLVVTRTEHDEYLVLAAEHAGNWALSGEVVTLTFAGQREELRFGRVAGEPVLVAEGRVFRRIGAR